MARSQPFDNDQSMRSTVPFETLLCLTDKEEEYPFLNTIDSHVWMARKSFRSHVPFPFADEAASVLHVLVSTIVATAEWKPIKNGR